MITAPANWDTLWNSEFDMQLRFTIDGVSYYDKDILLDDGRLTHYLYTSYGIGNACIGKLTITLIDPQPIARGVRKCTFACRLTNGTLTTSWVPQGTFYLNTVEKDDSGNYKLGLYDGLALCDVYMYPGGIVPSSVSYPRAASTEIRAVCTKAGITAPSDLSMFSGMTVTAPTNMTCRQILQSCAVMAGGNFTMSKDGKLKFVPLGSISGKPIYKVSVSDLTQTSEKEQVTGISLTAGDEEYSFGSDSGLYLQANSDYATQTIASNLYYKLSNPKYQGFKASGAYITPLCELGDYIEIEDSGEYMLLDSYSLLYEQGCWGSLEAPLKDAVEERIKYQTERDRKINNLQSATNANSSELAYMTTGEYLSELLERLNDEANENGGYTYITEGQGIRTYDVEVSDPLVGSEAHSVVEIKGGTIRIADTRDAKGDWNWKTVFTSGHIAAEIVTAANLTTGFIGAPSGNYWNLDTGELRMAANTISSLKDAIASELDVSDVVKAVDVEYGVSDASNKQPSSWSTSATIWKQGKFLWTRNRMTTEAENTKYSTARLLANANGLGVSSVTEQYYLSTSSTSATGGSWANTQQTFIAGRYYWTRSRIVWSDSTVTYSSPVLAAALTSGNQSSKDLDTRLNQREIFNRLTNSGKAQGLYISNNQLYINAKYIATGILSDAKGLNYWNLNTGEFQLRSVTELEKKVTAQKIGGTNLINGTDAWTGWSRTGSFTFSGNIAKCAAPSSASWSNWLNAPRHAKLTYGLIKDKEITISFEVRTNASWGTVSADNAVHCALCLFNNLTAARYRWRNWQCSVQPTTTWKKYSFTVQVSNAMFTGGSGSIADGHYFNVQLYNRSRKYVELRHVKLEIGNVATDWSASPYDAEVDAEAKAKAAIASANSYSANEVKKARADADKALKSLDTSFNQAKVFNRLTNNGKNSGIYLSGGQLYINATYIKTGTISANFVKTGILSATGKSGSFQINLNNGYTKLSNAELVNVNASGTISTETSYQKLRMSGGQIVGYHKVNKSMSQVGFIDASVVFVDPATKKQGYGLQLQAKNYLVIHAPGLGICRSSNTGTRSTLGYTGWVKFKNVLFRSGGREYYATMGLQFINGICVSSITN